MTTDDYAADPYRLTAADFLALVAEFDALIAQAIPNLDIDEEGGAERSEHGRDHGSAQTPLTPPG